MKLIDRLICVTGCAAVAAPASRPRYGSVRRRSEASSAESALANAKNRLNGSYCDGTDYTIAEGWERTKDGKYLHGGHRFGSSRPRVRSASAASRKRLYLTSKRSRASNEFPAARRPSPPAETPCGATGTNRAPTN